MVTQWYTATSGAEVLRRGTVDIGKVWPTTDGFGAILELRGPSFAFTTKGEAQAFVLEAFAQWLKDTGLEESPGP